MALLFYFDFDFDFDFDLFSQHAPGARRAPPRGWWPCSFILFVCALLFHFILVSFHNNTHQVLVGIPQGVAGLAILFYFSLFSYHAPGTRRAAPRGWWPCYYILISFNFFYNTHQVLVGLPQGVGGLANLSYFILIRSYNMRQVLQGLPQGDGGLVLLFYLFRFYFILVYFNIFLQHTPSAGKAPPRGWWPCHFILLYYIILGFTLNFNVLNYFSLFHFISFLYNII